MVQQQRDRDVKQVKQTKKVRQTSGVQVVIPYVKRLSEAVSRIFNKFGASVAIKRLRTIRNELVHPKDKVKFEEVNKCIYPMQEL